MPHIIVEYSSNLGAWIDQAAVRRLHAAAEESGLFAPATVRTRAVSCDLYAVGDCGPNDAFLHVTARIRPGRSEAARWSLTESLMAVVQDVLKDAYGTMRIGLTVEIDQIDPIRTLHSTLGPEVLTLGRKQ